MIIDDKIINKATESIIGTNQSTELNIQAIILNKQPIQ